MDTDCDPIDRLSATSRPPGRAIGYQRWHDLLFVHWRVSPAAIAARLPASLSVDTFDGSAWIGVVAFHMTGIRPWWLPPIPILSSFAETNVRTYVHFQGRDPGVWFFSLDAASSLAVRGARWRWHLPYHRANMQVERRDRHMQYASERLWPGQPGIGGTLKAEFGDLIGGRHSDVTPGRARPGTLDHFLIERYSLYTQSKHGQLLRARVHHSPYPIRKAEVLLSEQTFLRPLGLDRDRPPDHVAFSEGVSTEIFPLTAAVPAF
jgi:hypothetical protein